jgi:hypothetical protein
LKEINLLYFFIQNFQHSHITSTTMVSTSDLHEMDIGSPPHSPMAAMTSTANMQEMDMEQDDDDLNGAMPPPSVQPPLPRGGAPSAPVMISRIPANQLPLPPPFPPGLPTTALPPAIPTDRLPTPLKPQDVIIKSYNPKGR